MSKPESTGIPAGTQPVDNPRPSYCRRDGWLCTPENRCDEHRPERDPARLSDLLDRS